MREASLLKAKEPPDQSKKFEWQTLFRFMGPGFIMSLAYLDPGNLEADLQQGAYTNCRLLWVLWWSTVAGLLLQEMSSRLCVVTGSGLAESCKAYYPRSHSMVLYLMMELAIIGSDIQEVVGSAIAFQILFGWPLWIGCLVTALNTFVLLAIYQCRNGFFEIVIGGLITIIAVCFINNFLTTHIAASKILEGIVVPNLPASAMVTAMGTLGSVIMPHNIYLHSGLVKGKMPEFDRSSDSAISVLNRYSLIDSSVALFISFLVNLAVVGTFAHFFYAPECSVSNLACVPVMDNEVSFGEKCTNRALPISFPATCAEIGLDEAGDALASTIGPWGLTIWAVGLLAAGLASTMSTTFAGQVVMDGFLDLRLAPWQRATITRLAALGPSLFIAVFTSDNASLRNNINEWLNILQSIQLPFALIPVISFCASKRIMGDFRQRGTLLVASVLLALLVLFANIYLVTQFLVEHPTGGSTVAAIVSFIGLMYFVFVGILTKNGINLAREVPGSEDGSAVYGSIETTSTVAQI